MRSFLDDGGDVQWLLKQVDDTAMENFKNRLREDIHTMSHVPHLCDESFGGNLSGVAIAYKLWGLETVMCHERAGSSKRAAAPDRADYQYPEY